MAHAKQRKRRVAVKTGKRTVSTHKRKSARKGRSMHGLPLRKAHITGQVFDLLKKGGLMVLGFMGGREIERKVVKDSEGLKKFIGPIIQAGGGYVLARQSNESLKYIGYGLVGGGLVSGVGKVFGKDFVSNGILNGLQGLGDLRELISGPYTTETAPLNLPQFYNEQQMISSPETIDVPAQVIV